MDLDQLSQLAGYGLLIFLGFCLLGGLVLFVYSLYGMENVPFEKDIGESAPTDKPQTTPVEKESK